MGLSGKRSRKEQNSDIDSDDYSDMEDERASFGALFNLLIFVMSL